MLDRHPFDYFTCESATPEEDVTARLTVRFAPEEGVTLDPAGSAPTDDQVRSAVSKRLRTDQTT